MEIKIYFSKNDNYIAILYKYNKDVKCIFNPERLVGETLKEHKYGIFNYYDLEVLKCIKEGNGIEYIRKWDGDNSKFKIIDVNIKTMIVKNAQRRNVTPTSYIAFLNINLYSSIDEIEDRLYCIFKNNLIEGRIVKVENKLKNGKSNPQYINIYIFKKTKYIIEQ